ncbi:hypothetical protein SAMD00024442_8_58 [Candidatus Symbiothrix dinenymphae]|nr:hypothetical protein SAMD00024442_8_58 [Candidatus Symbiothrix dinenymphae]
MKSIKKFIRTDVARHVSTFIVAAIGIFPACSDYLDVVPDGTATIDNAFADRYTTEKYLASCYWALPRLGHWNSNPAWMGSMEMVMNRSISSDNAGMQQALGNNNSSAAYFDYWGGTHDIVGGEGVYTARSLYAGIRECNVFLENIDKVMDLTPADKARMIAEAKTLKAYMHFYLLCLYGPMTPLRENLPVDVSTAGIRLYREKIDVCFDYVIQLLDEAITGHALPAVVGSKSSEEGRFVHAAACYLKAKVCVFRASPLFNGNTAYNDFKDHNGEHFFNQTENPDHWVKAVDACRAAVAACAEGNIRLYQKSDYRTQVSMSDTTRLVNTLRSAVTAEWSANVETVWNSTASPIYYYTIVDFLVQQQDGNSAATGSISVPFSTAEQFYSNHGVPIDEDKEWRDSAWYNNRYQVRKATVESQYYIAKDENTAVVNFNREPRYYSSLGFDRGKWHSNYYVILPDEDTRFLDNLWGHYSSYKALTNYNVTGYFAKKMVSLLVSFRNPNAFDQTAYPYPDMRYASLLLYFAEALNETAAGESGTPPDEVYDLIDEVRARAGLDGVRNSWQNYAIEPTKPRTKKGMREIIQRERNIELAFEGEYYWDSRRWKTAEKEQNRVIQGWNVRGDNASTYYIPVSVYTQRFTQRDYFLPIKEQHIIENPLLIQNPGY